MDPVMSPASLTAVGRPMGPIADVAHQRRRSSFDVHEEAAPQPDGFVDRTDIAGQPIRVDLKLKIETGHVAESRANRLALLLGLASV